MRLYVDLDCGGYDLTGQWLAMTEASVKWWAIDGIKATVTGAGVPRALLPYFRGFLG